MLIVHVPEELWNGSVMK